jgi:hypothetical protein
VCTFGLTVQSAFEVLLATEVSLFATEVSLLATEVSLGAWHHKFSP